MSKGERDKIDGLFHSQPTEEMGELKVRVTIQHTLGCSYPSFPFLGYWNCVSWSGWTTHTLHFARFNRFRKRKLDEFQPNSHLFHSAWTPVGRQDGYTTSLTHTHQSAGYVTGNPRQILLTIQALMDLLTTLYYTTTGLRHFFFSHSPQPVEWTIVMIMMVGILRFLLSESQSDPMKCPIFVEENRLKEHAAHSQSITYKSKRVQ